MSEPGPKAIETVYGKYKYRSRSEARCAVFFDALGIAYEYEKEGYELDGLRYLPDFWLPHQRCWIEIKGEEPIPGSDIELRAVRLVKATECPLYLFFGAIEAPRPGHVFTDKSAYGYVPEDQPIREGGFGVTQIEGVWRGWSYWWGECIECGALDIVFGARAHLAPCGHFRWTAHLGLEQSTTDRLLEAYDAARHYRFEGRW